MPDVVAAIIEEGRRVLLQYRVNTDNHADHWGLPAGRIEPDESPHETLARELQEESGLKLLPRGEPDLFWVDSEGQRFIAFLVTEFTGSVENMEPSLCGELAWHDLERLPSPLTPATAALLASYRARARHRSKSASKIGHRV